MANWKEKLKIYDRLVEQCPNFERKGKTMPYTSANGYMFSLLNKDGELGIRFSKDKQEAYLQKYATTIFKSYGAVMRGYIQITDAMLQDEANIIDLLNESYNYVMTLEPK